jgi:hypothetical protein
MYWYTYCMKEEGEGGSGQNMIRKEGIPVLTGWRGREGRALSLKYEKDGRYWYTYCMEEEREGR